MGDANTRYDYTSLISLWEASQAIVRKIDTDHPDWNLKKSGSITLSTEAATKTLEFSIQPLTGYSFKEVEDRLKIRKEKESEAENALEGAKSSGSTEAEPSEPSSTVKTSLSGGD